MKELQALCIVFVKLEAEFKFLFVAFGQLLCVRNPQIQAFFFLHSSPPTPPVLFQLNNVNQAGEENKLKQAKIYLFKISGNRIKIPVILVLLDLHKSVQFTTYISATKVRLHLNTETPVTLDRIC